MGGLSRNPKGFAAVLCVALLVTASTFIFFGPGITDAGEEMVEQGKKVYNSRCVICHGPKGDGVGLVGLVHRVQKRGVVQPLYPRDFTVGVFKFRSTPTGCLPTDDDLMRIVTNGIPRAYMPSSVDLQEKEREAVIEYIKTFSERWDEEDACDSIQVKKPSWVGTASSVAKGEKLYSDMKCWECHGYSGKGDGPKSASLKDDWEDPILPFDFTSGATKLGFAPENVFTAYTTGLDGTGMPSYEDSMNVEERWHLVSYTLKLMGRLK